MTHMGKNKAETDIPALTRQTLDSVRIPASTRSKEEAWNLLVQKIERQKAPEPVKSLSLGWKTAAIAASLLLIISLAYFKYSTVSYSTSRGQHLSVWLPDGSEVALNACSRIQYPRYWFINSRKVMLNGEAFFKVTKGSTFTVISSLHHRVEVVGTQFNVTARDSIFKVTCYEGKVKVISHSGKSAILSKGNTTSIVGDSIIHHQNEVLPASATPAWTTGEFYFETAPLQIVMDELMRQYRVNIITNGFNPATRYYTGYFTNKDLKQALDWVTIPMNLKYTFLNDTTVNIYPAP